MVKIPDPLFCSYVTVGESRKLCKLIPLLIKNGYECIYRFTLRTRRNYVNKVFTQCLAGGIWFKKMVALVIISLNLTRVEWQ